MHSDNGRLLGWHTSAAAGPRQPTRPPDRAARRRRPARLLGRVHAREPANLGLESRSDSGAQHIASLEVVTRRAFESRTRVETQEEPLPVAKQSWYDLRQCSGCPCRLFRDVSGKPGIEQAERAVPVQALRWWMRFPLDSLARCPKRRIAAPTGFGAGSDDHADVDARAGPY